MHECIWGDVDCLSPPRKKECVGVWLNGRTKRKKKVARNKNDFGMETNLCRCNAMVFAVLMATASSTTTKWIYKLRCICLFFGSFAPPTNCPIRIFPFAILWNKNQYYRSTPDNWGDFAYCFRLFSWIIAVIKRTIWNAARFRASISASLWSSALRHLQSFNSVRTPSKNGQRKMFKWEWHGMRMRSMNFKWADVRRMRATVCVRFTVVRKGDAVELCEHRMLQINSEF